MCLAIIYDIGQAWYFGVLLSEPGIFRIKGLIGFEDWKISLERQG